MKIIGALLVALLAYLLLWPVNIEPQAWQPPRAPDSYAPNRALGALERIAQDVGIGPEAVNVDANGQLVTGFIDGRVARFAADGTGYELIADTGGRPLGIDFAANGDLIVADATRGLLRIDAAGSVRVLADEVDGSSLNFVDDVDVSSDDIAYFSDASVRFGVHEVRADFFEHAPNGRLVSHDLNSGETRVLLDGLYFANGVALGPGEEYLLINETAAYRVQRYWLKGERAGSHEVFIDNLPGLPDNITFNGRDRFWLALYSPRNAELDALLPHPFVRKIVFRLPRWLQPDPALHGFVLGIAPDGRVTHNLQDPGPGAYAPITSAREADGWLYTGSLMAPSLARMPLPPANLR